MKIKPVIPILPEIKHPELNPYVGHSEFTLPEISGRPFPPAPCECASIYPKTDSPQPEGEYAEIDSKHRDLLYWLSLLDIQFLPHLV